MKRILLIISGIVLITSALLSCSNKQAVVDNNSTTAIADEKGVTRFYQIETLSVKEPEETTLVEIVTNKKANTVTDKQGKYVTISNKAINNQKAKDTYHNSNSANNKPTDKSNKKDIDKHSENNSKDNNNVSFETSTEQNDKNNDNTINSSSEKTTDNTSSSKEDATDKDGWINRWY